MQPNYLIYVLFGKNKRYESELVYSLFSLKKAAKKSTLSKIKILIYSDHTFSIPKQLGVLEILFITLKKTTTERWIKTANNHFLVIKPMVLLEFLKKFKAPCIMVDTDTFFIQDPTFLFEKISKEFFLIHLDEHPISTDGDLVSFFDQKKFLDLQGNYFSIKTDFNMFNSGVIGLYPECMPILKDVVNLIRQIAARADWPSRHSHVIEQLSFSYYIQLYNLKISASDSVIMHYWFFKGCRYFLANNFIFFYQGEEEVHIKSISGLPNAQLPAVIIKGMKLLSLVQPWQFKYFPPQTLVGRLLRG